MDGELRQHLAGCVQGHRQHADQFGQVVGKGPGYIAMSAAVRNAAAVATKKTGQRWTTAEIQETVWSRAKTLYEKSSEQSMTTTQILEEGGYGESVEEAAAKEPKPELKGRRP